MEAQSLLGEYLSGGVLLWKKMKKIRTEEFIWYLMLFVEEVASYLNRINLQNNANKQRWSSLISIVSKLVLCSKALQVLQPLKLFCGGRLDCSWVRKWNEKLEFYIIRKHINMDAQSEFADDLWEQCQLVSWWVGTREDVTLFCLVYNYRIIVLWLLGNIEHICIMSVWHSNAPRS